MSVKNAYEGFRAILKGMKITFSYLLKEPVTIQYPDVKRKPQAMFRGRHYLRLWQDGWIAALHVIFARLSVQHRLFM